MPFVTMPFLLIEPLSHLRIVHQRVISLMEALCHLSLCHYHMEPLCHHTWFEDCTPASNFTHGIIEGLRPPKFRRGNFCVFCFCFQALAFSCPPCFCLASQHSLTCIFYWVWQHLRLSLHQRISLMESLCHLSLCHFHSSNHYAIRGLYTSE